MKRILYLVVWLCSFCAPVPAQSTNATISGGVTDPLGNFIPQAQVNVVNDNTGIVYSTQTNGSGLYLIPVLPPGSYHVQVSRRGFKTIIKADVRLNVQSALALNFSLPIGSTAESITIDAATSGINTVDASVSTVVDRKFVESMPLNGRSFQDLIQMTPGVVTQSPQTSAAVGYQGDFSVNGSRTESNYYTVDGVSAAGAGEAIGGPQAATSGSIAASSALGTSQSLLSVDALQEFRVTGSSYSAQYGRSPGGQFSFSTRAGTNQLHGSFFDYLRNDALDANDWFNNNYGIRRPALRQNDFGGTLGGPVWIPRLYKGSNKSFFFVSYEGLRLVQPTAASTLYVPSAGLRSTAAAALQPVLNAFPVPTGAEITTSTGDFSGLAPFVAAYSLPASINSTSVRIDHTLSKHMALFFRFSDTPSHTESRNLSQIGRSDLDTTDYTLGATSQLTEKLNNDFRFGMIRSASKTKTALDTFGGATPVDLRTVMGIPDEPGGYQATPYIMISGIGTAYLNVYQAENKLSQWNLTDTFNVNAGRHQLRFGIDQRRFSSPIVRVPVNHFSEFTTRQSMMANATTIVNLSRNVSAAPLFNQFAAFAQDEWRATSALSVSMGVRWEVNPPPGEAHGNMPYTLLGDVNDPSTLALAPRGTALWRTAWYSFAPRLGAAWSVRQTPGWETVLRAGGGVFYDTGQQLAGLGFAGLGFYTSQSHVAASLPIAPSWWNFSTIPKAPYTATSITAYPQHMQLPYYLEWNTSVEQALGAAQSFSVSYVASAGRRLLQEQQRNVSSLNPQFGSIYYVQNGITSNYQSLQLKFQRTVSHGIQSLVSYAWSHSLDFGSNNSALPLLYGNSDYDVRHNFQAGISWDLPEVQQKGLLRAVASGWSLDERLIARTGFPVTLQGTLIVDPSTGNRYYGNLNLRSNVPIYFGGSKYPGGRRINPAAFYSPLSATDSGNAPRNFVRGFGEFQWNSAVRRQLAIGDQLRVQLRAEAFNLLNHPNFGYVDPTITDAQFGLSTAMLNRSLGAMSSLYQQGGPRSMQLALKILF